MQDGESSYRRFLAGDKHGFEEVVDLYRDNLIFFINRYVHNLDMAEEIAADTFADLYVHSKRYRFGLSLKTYIFTIGRNKAVTWIRKQAKESRVLPAIEEEREVRSLEERVIQRERERQIHAALRQLKSEYQVVIHLLYFDRLSYEETAKVLGKNKKQIDNLAYRAKASLKSVLTKEGFIYED